MKLFCWSAFVKSVIFTSILLLLIRLVHSPEVFVWIVMAFVVLMIFKGTLDMQGRKDLFE